MTNLVLPRNRPRIFEEDGTLFPAFRELAEIYGRAHGLPNPSLHPTWTELANLVNNWIGAERQKALNDAADLATDPTAKPKRWNLTPMPEFAALNDDQRIVRLLTECGFIEDLLPTQAEIDIALAHARAIIDEIYDRVLADGVDFGYDTSMRPEAPGFVLVVWGGTTSPHVAKVNCTKVITKRLGVPVKRIFNIAGRMKLDPAVDNPKSLYDKRPWAPDGPTEGFIEPETFMDVPEGMLPEGYASQFVWDYIGKWRFVGQSEETFPHVEYVMNVQAIARELGAGHHLIFVTSIMPHPFHLISTQRLFWETGVEGATYEFVFLLPTSPIPVERPCSSGVDGVGNYIKNVANAVAPIDNPDYNPDEPVGPHNPRQIPRYHLVYA